MKIHAVGCGGDHIAGAVALIYVLQFHECHRFFFLSAHNSTVCIIRAKKHKNKEKTREKGGIYGKFTEK